MLYLVIISLVFDVSSSFGPVYPITAAFFKDRFSISEWNKTLDTFKSIGGDTVILRAPSLIIRTKENLDHDPDYMSCSSSAKSNSSCYDAATEDLLKKGLKIHTLMTYSYEENYGPAILSCPGYDKIIPGTGNKKYYRLVLPATTVSADCRYDTSVVVVLTVFSGVDPHQLLLQSAFTRNLSVVFGIPGKHDGLEPSSYNLYPAYMNWIERVLKDHQSRYSMSNFYKTVKGYVSRDEFMMADIDSKQIQLYKDISGLVHLEKKKFVITADIELTKMGSNKTIDDHIQGFSKISQVLSMDDIILVHEGRGFGRAGFYWSTQLNQAINESDTILLEILKRLYPTIKPNITYGEMFTGSVQQLFLALHGYRTHQKNSPELWLLVETLESLQDDTCLPVDTKGSGNAENLERTSKSRVDRSLTAAAAAVQKVVAFAFDPDFTCTTKNYKVPLADEISHDASRPIISNCSFHSAANRSVVVIGYNLDGETQGFQVEWPDRDGKRHNSEVHGYYFELDYGQEHGLVPSLEYTQLYDPYDIISLADHGYVKVQAEGSYHDCQFLFDYRSAHIDQL